MTVKIFKSVSGGVGGWCAGVGGGGGGGWGCGGGGGGGGGGGWGGGAVNDTSNYILTFGKYVFINFNENALIIAIRHSKIITMLKGEIISNIKSNIIKKGMKRQVIGL